MAGRAVRATLVAWCGALALAGAARGAETTARLEHTSRDPMKCKVCRPAYEKALAYVRKNLKRSRFPVKTVAGWTFLADGRCAEELGHCVDAAIDWQKQPGYNPRSHSGNWYPALAGVFLAEYYKYRRDPRVLKAMQGIVDHFVKTQERTGGWWKWHEGAYKDRLDYAVVDHGFVSSLVLSFFYTAKVHGVTIPKETFQRGDQAILNITTSRGIGYGMPRGGGSGWGDKTGGRGGMLIPGLGYAGRLDHEVYKTYKTLLAEKLPLMDQGHHVGSFHCLALTLGSHHQGPQTYRKLTDLWLDKLIRRQDAEGGLYIGDDGDAGGEPVLMGGNVAATASFALLIRLQDPDRLVPKDRRRRADGSLTVDISAKLVRAQKAQEARLRAQQRREAADKARKAEQAAVAAVLKGVEPWNARLLARIQAALAGGKAIEYESPWLRGTARIAGIDAKKRLLVSDPTGSVSMPTPLDRLPPSDRKALALALVRAAEPGDHCLVAYYAAASGETAQCREHLARAGEAAAELNAFLKKCGLLD